MTEFSNEEFKQLLDSYLKGIDNINVEKDVPKTINEIFHWIINQLEAKGV